MTGDAAHADLLRLPAAGAAGKLRARGRQLIAVLAAAFVLAGCGDLPRPFQGAEKAGNPVLSLPDSSGIAVLPVTGLTPRGDARMATAMAKALRAQNVPARVSSGSNDTRWLMGHAEAAGTEGIRLTWELYGEGGGLTGVHEHVVPITRTAWRAGASDRLARVARRAAPQIAGLVQDRPEQKRSGLRGFPEGTRVVVEPATGKPTEGARELAPAMASALRRRGLPLADTAQPGDIVISGTLGGKALSGGGRRLRITWVVEREGRAQPLGDLNQSNAVPEGVLEQGWPALSRRIARAAVPGILRVLRAAASQG
ncbi:hypothetical protein SAMN05216241_101218 [Limimonas halophila]|uniref:Uncharacterized protein n=1 Tax=Limimonas halophila TaxID=1082479 RepID=A0A1G7LEP9_9PROT|nr:hypothetical protein [Limimonas halophila]SDF47871.1 hypothetical protein SAMN05216241_101218 [Limimonas halophila]